MKQLGIKKPFDMGAKCVFGIVDFAEVERFLDTGCHEEIFGEDGVMVGKNRQVVL